MNWLERIFRRRHPYDELAEELREHIEEKAEQLMRLENLSRDRSTPGGPSRIRKPTMVETRSRDVWQWPRLNLP